MVLGFPGNHVLCSRHFMNKEHWEVFRFISGWQLWDRDQHGSVIDRLKPETTA
jgi:hypothetical protein